MTVLNAVDAETAAVNLHRELRALLDSYLELRKDTNSEPTFESEHDPDKRAERALYNHRPLADWETSIIQGWQPIQSAPKDGKPILGYSAEGVSYVCWWKGYGWCFLDTGKVRHFFEPTHWMPHPPLPATSSLTSNGRGGE
jgi:hypothetical protein